MTGGGPIPASLRQANGARDQYFNIPEGARTVCNTAKLNADNQFEMEISDIKQMSPDTIWMSFKFDSPDLIMGLNIAMHMIWFMPYEGKQLGRKYTPVSPINQKGSVDYVVKCYPKTEEFPDGGKLSQFLLTKRIGDKILMEGPVGRTTYIGNGMWRRRGQTDFRKTKIGLICGGSGITPVFHVLDAIYRAKETVCEVKMIFSNKTVDDILLREQLDKINNDKSMPNLTVTHTITRHDDSKHGPLPKGMLKGRVSLQMIQ